MAISRMQQPRQMYGLGSLVKSVTKGAKKFVSGAVDTVKDVAKSPIGKAAMLYFGGNLLQGNALFGNPFTGRITDFITSKGLPSIFTKKAGEKTLGDVAKVFAGGSLLGGLLAEAEETGDPEGITRDVGALKLKLADAYRNQRTFADAEDEEAAIAKQVELDTAEYNQDMARGVMATGGRAGFALGTPEQNAMKASGIMGLPLNQNPAGVKELDLRETGGFIPPVGVKEKADDIPAMLSNNEFVFTADAVRGMGDGNVNKGAQRMYDMMKKLEKGGRV
jgi:hypothetical protein